MWVIFLTVKQLVILVFLWIFQLMANPDLMRQVMDNPMVQVLVSTEQLAMDISCILLVFRICDQNTVQPPVVIQTFL